jgi:predicted house-cleaning noncanonical NTP pyrophosphatase (MazG superfamily)
MYFIRLVFVLIWRTLREWCRTFKRIYIDTPRELLKTMGDDKMPKQPRRPTPYMKLVRNRIPTIIEDSGKVPIYRELNDDEYEFFLRRKLREEVDEYLAAETDRDGIEELADMLEVMYALTHIHGKQPADMLEAKARKKRQRGGFDKRILLIDVRDE